jgi:DNA-binding YbaB/EbfC family protein
MDFGGMLKKAQEMQQKMMKAKASLKNLEAEGVANNGAVKVILNGDHEMIKIDIDPKLMTEDKDVLEDLIIIATNNAKKEIDAKSSEAMSKITSGLKLPPGFKFPF